MRALFLTLFLLTASVRAATCTGGANCQACTDCKYCVHCGQLGGTCSHSRPDLYRTPVADRKAKALALGRALLLPATLLGVVIASHQIRRWF